MRVLARRGFARLLTASGLPFAVRQFLQRRRVTILVFHDPQPTDFSRHLAALARRYSIISLLDFAHALRQKSFAGLPPRPLVITLDDGHRGNINLLDCIRLHATRPTIFVCSDIVGTNRRFWFLSAPEEAVPTSRVPDRVRLERLSAKGFREQDEHLEPEALTWEEVERLAAHAEIQSHTATHPFLPQCSTSKAMKEIVGSKRTLEERVPDAVYAIAYPSGSYSERDCGLVAKAGYAIALTCDPGFNNIETDPFRVKRMVIGDSDSVPVLLAKASGLWWIVKYAIRKRPYGFVEARSGTEPA